MSITNPVSRTRLAEPIDLSNYAPYYITTIANRWTASSSRIYQRDFGIGIAEWRVLAALSVFATATSLEIANLISMDTAAVSRATNTLLGSGHVRQVPGRFKGRNKPLELTDSGAGLYKRVRQVALRREKALLRNLGAEERSALLRALRKIHDGMSEM